MLCLADENPGYDSSPLELIGAVELEDLFHGGPPCEPTVEVALVRGAVGLVLDRLEQRAGAVVHCAGGTGRTGTLLGVVLARLGHESDRVVESLDGVHRARRRAGWPEAEWQAVAVREAGSANEGVHSEFRRL
ncbi:MAG: tyrosine-protein phosphatase [Polyangiaceae bacterium]|nr:tyrosine-protein phosphatase [Polyangiaceae bacterium]MCL4754286.1 tyrosine-protein phosphatase [Myxococcales bacterium]